MVIAQTFKLFISGIPIIIGFILLSTSLAYVAEGYKSENWLKTKGEVFEGYESKGMIAIYSYVFHNYDSFSYLYEVNGIEFKGYRIGIGVNSSSKDYYKGELVDVYYDPLNPSNSVLVKGVSYSQFFTIIIACGLIAVGAALWKRIRI